LEHLAVKNFKKINVTNKIVIAGLLSWSLAAGLSACGGGGGGGGEGLGGGGGGAESETDSGLVFGMGNGDGSGAIDLLKYMFPSSSQTQYLDEYKYSSGTLLSVDEASIARTTTLNGSRITEEEDFGFGPETTVYAITDNSISSNEGTTIYRHADIGDILFTLSFQTNTDSGFYLEVEGQCSLNNQLSSFSMMSNKTEANYATYNDVLEMRCLNTFRFYGDNSKATLHHTDTDITYSYSARDIGQIGEYNPDCVKYDAAINVYYVDDTTPNDCADSYEFIEVLEPKI
jgi:hypothetical protein